MFGGGYYISQQHQWLQLLQQFFKKAPLALKRAAKWLALRELKRIKRVRFNYSAVTYEIMKSHALMLLFSMLCIAYFYVYVQTSQSSLNWLVLAIKTSPLYVVEILYLIQRDRTKSLVHSVGRIRITKRLRVIPNAQHFWFKLALVYKV